MILLYVADVDVVVVVIVAAAVNALAAKTKYILIGNTRHECDRERELFRFVVAGRKFIGVIDVSAAVTVNVDVAACAIKCAMQLHKSKQQQAYSIAIIVIKKQQQNQKNIDTIWA